MESLYDVVKVTQWKDGCVYKTKIISQVWLKVGEERDEQALAKQAGGDMLQVTQEYRF